MSNITVTIENAKNVTSVQEMCDQLCLNDPNFNGANIVVEVGDFTCVDDKNDEIRGASLLASVFNFLSA